MIYQTFIPGSGYSLFGCVTVPDNYQNIVILFPGYSHSKSDMDFILSDMKNVLVNNGNLVIQVDLYGHGDSYGDFSDCGFDMIKENINEIVSWVKSEFKGEIKAFSRGIIGNVLLEPEYDNAFSKKIILNPVFLYDHDIEKINKILKNNENEDLVDFNDYSLKLDEDSRHQLFTYLYALGSESRNIRGMEIKLSTLRSFLEFSKTYNSENGNNLLIFSNSVEKIEPPTAIRSNRSLEFYENCFVRDPRWIEKIINAVVDFL